MPHLSTLIRLARQDAGFSQEDLAARAGTSQPALARYESGATIPTFPTLERLLSACGRRLEISTPRVLQAAPAPATSIRGRLGQQARVLRRRRGALLRAASKHGIANVRVFGSLARGEAHEDSDVDLLVDLKPGRTLVDVAAFRREAMEILDLPVDVATTDMLKERIRADALREALAL